MKPGADWLARGGTYDVLAFVWIVSAVFYYFLGTKLGQHTGSPNDGCLYGICNILLSFLGGGLGFLALLHNYPYFILSSIFGAVALPSIGTFYMASRARARK